jgi:hypothetical protein
MWRPQEKLKTTVTWTNCPTLTPMGPIPRASEKKAGSVRKAGDRRATGGRRGGGHAKTQVDTALMGPAFCTVNVPASVSVPPPGPFRKGALTVISKNAS